MVELVKPLNDAHVKVGVPVDIKVENKLTDVENNSDSVLLRALQHIKK